MNLIDDPRLTTYALGEMTDAERTAFEAELANDPAAQEEVVAIQATAESMRGELKQELETIAVTPAAATVPSASESKTLSYDGVPIKPRRPTFTTRRVLFAAAASVAVGALVVSMSLPSLNRARGVAYHGGDRSKIAVVADRETPEVVEKTLAGKRQPLTEQSVAAGTSPPSAHVFKDQVAQPGVYSLSAREITLDKAVISQEMLSELAAPDAASRGARAVLNPSDAADAKLELGVLSNTPLTTAAPGASRDAKVLKQAEARSIPGLLDRAKEKVATRLTTNGRADDELGTKRLVDSDIVSTESYAPIHDNPFLAPTAAPLSTFGVDVDTASFANVRRFLTSNTLPPADAVRIEELVNYFPTTDAPPTDDKPFAVRTEVGECPWAQGHQLLRVALKGKVIENAQRPSSNLVFLIDVSGSMNEPAKLPLVKRALRKLVGQLGENDRVAIVVYAGSSGLVLPSTNAGDKTKILQAIDNLEAGGSTNGGQGIELAYATAGEAFIKGGTNRVILCTDGDFNVGLTDRGALFQLIEAKAKAGTFLSVCGFGSGNVKDDTMEGLADKGNGNYAYIDTDREADKVFVQQMGGTLVTIAKDVKLQLEFNPATVKSYRLIGYENRVLKSEDFNNDLKDAGDIGAGHSVVALYEIEPAGPARSDGKTGDATVEPLKYQPVAVAAPAPKLDGVNTDELLTLKLRFKKPDAPLEQGVSELIETVVKSTVTPLAETSADFRFAASVAGFGMMLRESPYRQSCTWGLVRSLGQSGVGPDAGGYRSEFLNLIDTAARMKP